jgi:1-acyl-sn-glycerol-3-phosphate acyltransferase
MLADWCLRMVALRAAAALTPEGRLSGWHLATALFIAPFILLSPLNGCLNNALPRRWVLTASAGWTLLAVCTFALLGGGWLICLALVALGTAVYSPARYAVLPAGSQDTHLPLPRVSGWMEMGASSAIVGGMALGWFLVDASWPNNGLPLTPVVVAILIGLNGLCLLTAVPVAFPSDVRRPEGALQAVAGFFRDCRRIAREPLAGSCLLGIAVFQALGTAGSGALVALSLDGASPNEGDLLLALAVVGVGLALGCALASLEGHPLRCLGLVPFGALGLMATLCWVAATATPGTALPLIPCLLLGLMGGLVHVPLKAVYLHTVPADARGNGMAVLNMTIYVATVLLALSLVGLVTAGVLPSSLAQVLLLAGLTAVVAVLAWYLLGGYALQVVLECLLLPMYRVRAHGPGQEEIPQRGPLLIVSNHASYLDPCWLAKVLPRDLTPMMTSVFFDRPVLRWLLTHMARIIRVPSIAFRREAPELDEAIAVLREGGCVLIFPESMVRRSQEQSLRMFARGVWHILHELPQTPVVVCWIEGGWGSLTSYSNGPPFRNKPLDWRRPIDIGIAEPEVLAPALLADQRATRFYLMRRCLECRRYLGLDVPPTLWTQETDETDPDTRAIGT